MSSVVVHGIRLYPQTVTLAPGQGAPMFVHRPLKSGRPDFDYVFGPLAERWRGHYFVRDFATMVGTRGERVDPLPALLETYGDDLADVDGDPATQLLSLTAEGMGRWAHTVDSFQGALLLLFGEPPDFAAAREMFWGRTFQLRPDTWPAGMRAVVQNWDGVFWQMFTTDAKDADALSRAHANDPRLKMYRVDLELEYPNPSNRELTPL